MIARLSTDGRRRLTGANFVYYPEPALHPDRVLHEHDLIFLVEGEWEICQDGARHTMQPGDVLLLAADRHHYGLTPCAAGSRTMYLHFSAEPSDGQEGCGLTLSTLTKSTKPSVHGGFRQLIDIYWSDNPQREIRTAALLDLLLCDLALKEDQPTDAWPVSAVRSVLLNRPNVNFTVAALATELGVSERRLRYLFYQACGVSVHRYQMNLKLDMARQLLLTEPDRTLAGIAETFGFSDEFHLSHAYKARFGHAPREDRRTR